MDADVQDLVFVPNATTGVNSVLRSLTFSPEDEILTTNHEYNACRNALDFIASRTGARVVVAKVPFPIDSPQQVIAAVIERGVEVVSADGPDDTGSLHDQTESVSLPHFC